jgi:hypothetical protein
MIKTHQKSIKQSTQVKEKCTKYKDSSLSQKKTTNKGELQREHEQIKYSNPLSQGAYQIRKGKEHLPKHLIYMNPHL